MLLQDRGKYVNVHSVLCLFQVMGDNLLLSSVFQFSRKIRQSIDKTAGKIRYRFVAQTSCFSYPRCWDMMKSMVLNATAAPGLFLPFQILQL